MGKAFAGLKGRKGEGVWGGVTGSRDPPKHNWKEQEQCNKQERIEDTAFEETGALEHRGRWQKGKAGPFKAQEKRREIHACVTEEDASAIQTRLTNGKFVRTSKRGSCRNCRTKPESSAAGSWETAHQRKNSLRARLKHKIKQTKKEGGQSLTNTTGGRDGPTGCAARGGGGRCSETPKKRLSCLSWGGLPSKV